MQRTVANEINVKRSDTTDKTWLSLRSKTQPRPNFVQGAQRNAAAAAAAAGSVPSPTYVAGNAVAIAGAGAAVVPTGAGATDTAGAVGSTGTDTGSGAGPGAGAGHCTTTTPAAVVPRRVPRRVLSVGYSVHESSHHVPKWDSNHNSIYSVPRPSQRAS